MTTTNEEYCDGVKILLKRMESNPEEFKQGNKWNHLLPETLGGYTDWPNMLSPEEQQALKDGMRKIQRSMFTDKVMATLLEDKEEVDKRTVGGGGTAITSSWNDPRMLAQNSIQPNSMYPLPTNPYSVSNSSIEQRRLAQELKDLGLFSVLKAKFKNL